MQILSCVPGSKVSISVSYMHQQLYFYDPKPHDTFNHFLPLLSQIQNNFPDRSIITLEYYL